jgi:hypothetical protein
MIGGERTSSSAWVRYRGRTMGLSQVDCLAVADTTARVWPTFWRFVRVVSGGSWLSSPSPPATRRDRRRTQ